MARRRLSKYLPLALLAVVLGFGFLFAKTHQQHSPPNLSPSQRQEELRIYIKISSHFGSEQEFDNNNKIEDQLEQILVDAGLGKWTRQEVGAGFYSIFFDGTNSAAMYQKLEPQLKRLLPKGSYVELEDVHGNIRTIRL